MLVKSIALGAGLLLAPSTFALAADTITHAERADAVIYAGAPISNITVRADNVVQCAEARISWTGAADPITLYIAIGGFYVGEQPVETRPDVYGGSATWRVNQRAGENLHFRVTDAGGQVAYVQGITVQRGDSWCLDSGSQGASSPSASATSAAQSQAPSPASPSPSPASTEGSGSGSGQGTEQSPSSPAAAAQQSSAASQRASRSASASAQAGSPVASSGAVSDAAAVSPASAASSVSASRAAAASASVSSVSASTAPSSSSSDSRASAAGANAPATSSSSASGSMTGGVLGMVGALALAIGVTA